jgi:hypothetical protein
MGHSVSPHLPSLVIDGEAQVITMLREPWKRIQSDFHYLQSRHSSGHLGPNLNVSVLLSSVTTVIDYALYPGIANCATKVSRSHVPKW